MASFLFTQRILMFIRRISEAPFYANLPTIYNLMASKNNPLIRKKVSVYIFLSLGILASGLFMAGAIGNNLLEFLNIDTRLVPTLIFAIMAVSIILDVNASFHASIYISTNHVPFLIPAIVSGIAILGGGFLVVDQFGLIGIVLVQLIVQAMFNFWYPVWKSFQLIKWNLMRYFKDLPKNGFIFIGEKLNLTHN